MDSSSGPKNPNGPTWPCRPQLVLRIVPLGKAGSIERRKSCCCVDGRPQNVSGLWELRGEAGYGATNWVQYEWSYAHQIKEISVFWFVDKGGGLSQPTETLVEYCFGTGEWISLGSIGNNLDVFNTLTVDVTATKVRLSMKSNTSTGISEFKVMGIETTSCDTVEITPYVQLNDREIEAGNAANLIYGDSVRFIIVPEGYTGAAYYSWRGPNNLSSTDSILVLTDLQAGMEGGYQVAFTNECGSISYAYFYLTLSAAIDGSAYEWPEYSPTVAYDASVEFPDLQMPTQDLPDVRNVAWTISDRWWTFKAGPNARSVVTAAAVEPMLDKFNEDFAYIRDVMGWPPDKRAKNGYRSAIYLYGSGLSTDNADSTALGGWQGSVYYNGGHWAMVLASYYPVYCFDPACPYGDKGFQTGAMIHEGIHCILADLPGCRNAAWFHEGGNTGYNKKWKCCGQPIPITVPWAFERRYSSFMPIECYSGWLQDESSVALGRGCEYVRRKSTDLYLKTFGARNTEIFPVFLGMTLGYRSIP